MDGTTFEVIVSVFVSMCPSGDRISTAETVTPIGVKFCRTVDISSGKVLSLGGNILGGSKCETKKERIGFFGL